MCLILLSYTVEPSRDLLVLANRDEFLDRPTAQAGFWDDAPNVLGGRDLKSGGSWLSVTESGRFAAVTNVRDPERERPDALSRGHLVADFVRGTMSATEWADRALENGEDYNGFNLLVYDGSDLVYASNRTAEGAVLVPPGIHGLSNAALDTPWPKVSSGRQALRDAVQEGNNDMHALLEILEDDTLAPDHALPQTGVPLEWERILSARCIVSERYGTRCSTVVRIKPDHDILFMEKTHHPESTRPRAVTFELIVP